MPINIYDRLESAFGGAIVNADDVSVDTTGLEDLSATNIQQIASELERLYTLVRSIQNDASPSGRSLVLFDNSVSISGGNYNTYAHKNAIYSANNNQVVSFTLPLEENISTYPSTFEITHLGGTGRFDTGENPTNTINVNLDASDTTQIESPSGTTMSEEKVYRGDTIVISKSAPSANWIARKGQLNLARTVLPNGIFTLKTQTVDLSGSNVEGLGGVTVSLGDAFVVGTGGSALGTSVSTGSVLVAKTDSPSLVGGQDNDDWLIIGDVNNSELTLQEIRFLAQVIESDTPVDTRVDDGTADRQAVVWLSPYILDHEPNLIPANDPNNPQSGESESYIGGTTNQNANRDFQISSNHYQSLLYVGIQTAFLNTQGISTNDIYVQLFDLDGNKLFEYNLNDDFVPPVPAITGADKTYFGYSAFNLADSFTSIRYSGNQTIRIIHRTQDRQFSLSDSVHVTSNIEDVQESQLSQTVQAKLNKEISLQHVDRVRLDAIETTETTTAIPISPSFSFKAKYGAISHLDSDYQTIQNNNGLIGDYDRSSPIVIRVASNVTVTHLDHDGLPTIPVTEITPSLFDNEKTYTASIPGISGSISNTIFDHQVFLVGTIANEEATGLDDSIKVGIENLDDPLDELVHRSVNNPYQLPDNLQTLSDNLTVTTNERREWSTVQPAFLGHELTREFALLYDFNWYTYSGTELNEFDDITGVEVAGYSNDDFHRFDDANDSHNTAFRGRNNYISNDVIQVRNESGVSPAPIDDTFRKIMFFDYSYQNQLGEDQRDTILKLGSGSEEPLLEYTDEHGLVMRISTQDAPSTTRNRNVPTLVENGQWSINDGVNSAPTTRIILPDDITSGQSVPVRITLRVTEGLPIPGSFVPGAGTYTATEHVDITITNIDSDQSFSSHTFSYVGLTHESVTVGISYDHDHTVNGETRRTILLTPTLPLESGHVGYDVSATFTATETFRPGTSFTDLVLSSNKSLHTTNRIGMIFQKYREDDTDSDPTIGIKLILNGRLFGSDANDYVINTHRRASQFTFDDIEYGGRWIALSRIQTYRYNPVSIPTGNDLTVYYREIDNWLGTFTNVAQEGVLFRIERLDIHDDDIPTDEQLTQPMRFLSNHLTLDNDSATGDWRRIVPEPIESGLTRRVAIFFDEDKTVNSGNLFDDVTGITIGGYDRKTRYYPNPNASINTDLPGVQSYMSNGVINISNTTGDTPIPNSPNLILGFDYSQLGGVLTQSLVRFGGAVEPLLSTNSSGELVLNIGAQNGTRRSRNYEIPLSIEDNHWNSTTDDDGNNARTEVPLSFSNAHPTITVNANLHVSGVDTGNDSHTFTFTNDIRDTDTNFGTITFDFGGGETIDVTASYTFSSRKLSLTAVNSLTDATKVYNFTATIRTFEAWHIPDVANHPNQAYHEQVLHLGNATLRERNRVLMMLAPFRLGDSDSDPEMGLRIIVNNTRGSEAYYDHTFRTYRPESDFDFNNITLGSTLEGGAPTFAIGRVQLYNYDSALPPSSNDLLLLYSGLDRFLDAFTNQDPGQTRLQLDSDLEFDENRTVIIKSPNGTKYEIAVSDAGVLSATVLT